MAEDTDYADQYMMGGTAFIPSSYGVPAGAETAQRGDIGTEISQEPAPKSVPAPEPKYAEIPKNAPAPRDFGAIQTGTIPLSQTSEDMVRSGTFNMSLGDALKEVASKIPSRKQEPESEEAAMARFATRRGPSGEAQYVPRRFSYEYDVAGNVVKAIPLAEPGRYIGEGANRQWVPGEVFTERERQAISKEASKGFVREAGERWQNLKEGRGMQTNEEAMLEQAAGRFARPEEPTTLGEKMIQARRLKKLGLLPKSLLDQYLNPDLSNLTQE
jgi:hypothetical protein